MTHNHCESSKYQGELPATAGLHGSSNILSTFFFAISTIQFPTVFDTAPRVFQIKSNLCQLMNISQQIPCSWDKNIQIVHVT